MTPETIKAVIIAAIAALLFSAGWTVEGWRKDGEIARLERAQADERARDAVEASAELQAAVKHGNQLAARVTTAETARDVALQETQDALRKSTTGRPCLNGGTVRLLNGAGLNPPAVPATAGQPAGADAAAASDTDVALWAAHARRSYDTCRGRLDALAEYFQEPESAR